MIGIITEIWLNLGHEKTWTLAIVLKATRPWGFWHEGKWIHWREYVDSEAADTMKS
jgi:hypothetical protein